MLQLGGMVSTGVAGISCSWCGLAYHSSPACQEALRWTSVTMMTVTCHVSRVMCHVSRVTYDEEPDDRPAGDAPPVFADPALRLAAGGPGGHRPAGPGALRVCNGKLSVKLYGIE